MDLSCVLLTWNSAPYIERCLRSLEADLRDSGLEHSILVVDNGSTDATREILSALKREGLPLEVVLLDRNKGTTVSRNIALKRACGRYIAVLDSDIEIQASGTLHHLIDSLESQPGCAIVAPALRFPSGRPQKSVDVFPTLMTKIKRYLFLRQIEQKEGAEAAGRPAELREVDYAISAFWVFRRSLLDEVGLLDENIFYAPEDVDYCLRCWLKGYTVLYDPRCVVVHHSQEISRKKLFSAAVRNHIQGLLYYYRKHGYLFSRRRIYRRIRSEVASRRGPI